MRVSAAAPTAVAPPTSNAYTASATKNTHPPTADTAQPICSRRSCAVASALASER